MKHLQTKLIVALSVVLVGSSAFAVPPDFTSLTSSVDFTTVTTAILAVAALIVPVYLVWKGSKMIIRAVKGA